MSNVVIAPVGGVPNLPEPDVKPVPPTDQTPPLVRRLEERLQLNQQRFEQMDAYYRGEHRNSMLSSDQFQQAFGRQLRSFADNWMKLVISVTNNRLKVEGFRVGTGLDTDSVDQMAWKIWRANRLTKGSRVAHRDAMKFGTSFLLVDPFGPTGGPLPSGATPKITIESPYQVAGIHRPDDRTALVAAIKKWVGDDGYVYLNFYLPEVVQKYRSMNPSESVTFTSQARLLQPASWQLVGEVENPLGQVPLVPIENEADPMLGGESDLTDLIPLNDALNKTLKDALVSSEYQGFRQRILTGVEVAKDPETGKPLTEDVAALVASQSRAWVIPGENAKFYEAGQVDLTGHMSLADTLIHHISEISQTPAYMLVGKMANLPLAIDTIVPTPSGRTTMGDLKVGDDIFAPNGEPVRVTEVLPIKYGRECFRLTFDDGTEIVADAEHKWETTHFIDPSKPYKRGLGARREQSVVTTSEIARSVKTSMGTNNHFIPVANAHRGPDLRFPIDPYALGVWLGDGGRGTSQITSHRSEAFALADRLRAVGETVTVRSYAAHDTAHKDTMIVNPTHDLERCRRGHVRPRGTKKDTARCVVCSRAGYRRRRYGERMPTETNTSFRRRLGELGVLHTKHVPEQYFQGSEDQRLALLQGIMDTDGSVAAPNTTGVCLTLHDERLARDVHRLASSLGHKVNLRRRAWRKRTPGVPTVTMLEGECWRMSWTPRTHIVFRMERKAAMQRFPTEGSDGRGSSPFRRYIVSCERTESVPVRCINVASAEHLFCVTDSFVATRNSADAIRAAELGFVGKLEGKQEDYSPSWERAMGLAFAAMKQPQEDGAIETIWKDAAANSGSVLANELNLMSQLGVPQQALLEKYGYSPMTIARWEEQGLLTPPAPNPTVAPPGTPVSSSTSRVEMQATAPREPADD